MLVVPFVCAEFHDAAGNTLCRIRPDQLRMIVEVPESIVQDPLYEMLVGDGSLRAPENRIELKKLENDPVQKAPKTAENDSSAAPAGAAAPADSADAPTEGKTAGRKTAEKK